MRAAWIAPLFLFFAAAAVPADIRVSVKFLETSKDYVELPEGEGIRVDLRYATTNNFTGQNLYGDFKRAYLHRDAAKKFFDAVARLRAAHPGYKLVVFDALRPRSVQRKLWDVVKGTDQQMYVADPDKGSVHNYGLAIDCSVLDEKGRELDMGTPFDFFGELAQPAKEAEFVRAGKLTARQLENRMILRRAMEAAGFQQLQHEWWHYNSIAREAIQERYSIVE